MRTYPQPLICWRIQLYHLPSPFPHHHCCSLSCCSFTLGKWTIVFLHRSPPLHWPSLSLSGSHHLLQQLPYSQCQLRFAHWQRQSNHSKLSSRRGLWCHPHSHHSIHPQHHTTKQTPFSPIPLYSLLYFTTKKCHHIYHCAGLLPYHQQCLLHTGSNSKVVPFTFHQSCGTHSNPTPTPSSTSMNCYRHLGPPTFFPHPIFPTVPLSIEHDNQQQRDFLRDLKPVHRWQCSKHHPLKAESTTSLLPFPFHFWTYLYHRQHNYAPHCFTSSCLHSCVNIIDSSLPPCNHAYSYVLFVLTLIDIASSAMLSLCTAL